MKKYICLLGLIGLVGMTDVSAKPKKKPLPGSHPTPAGRKRQREMCQAMNDDKQVGERYKKYVNDNAEAMFGGGYKVGSLKSLLALESVSDKKYFAKANVHKVISACNFEWAIAGALHMGGLSFGGDGDQLCSHPEKILDRKFLGHGLEDFPGKEQVLDIAEKMLKNPEVKEACFEMIKTQCDYSNADSTSYHTVNDQGLTDGDGHGAQRQLQICKDMYLDRGPYASELKKMWAWGRTRKLPEAIDEFAHAQTSIEWLSKLEKLSDKEYFVTENYKEILGGCSLRGLVMAQLGGGIIKPTKLVAELAKKIEERPAVKKAKAEKQKAKEAADKALKDYQDVVYKHLPF